MAKRKTIVSLILVNNDNKLLVGRRNPDRATDPGKVVFPGGHVEEGEELLSALQREAKEELDIKLKDPKIVYTSDFDGPEEQQRLHWYACSDWEGEIKPIEDNEIFWIGEDELDQLSYQVSRDAAIEYFRSI
jgi:8-oxo-dGTP diphosphatase